MVRTVAAAAAALVFAAGASAGVTTYTFDLSGLPGDGGFFDNFPTLQHNFGVEGTVTNIEFSLNGSATDPSWQSEVLIFIDGAANGLGDFDTILGEDFGLPDAPGTFAFSGNFAADITSDGVVSITVADAFNDAVTPDYTLGAGSFITVTFEAVPAPGALALLGLGGALAARRRR